MTRSSIALTIFVAVTVAIGFGYWTRLPHSGIDCLSFDGFRYLAGAESIMAGHGYRDIDGSPQFMWPPGTSLLYALTALATRKPPEMLIGAIGLGAYALIWSSMLWSLLSTSARRWLVAIGFAALALNGSILSATSKLWSDNLALACFSLTLLCVVREKRGAAVAAAAAAIVFRFAMVAAVPFLIASALVSRAPRRHLILTLLAPLPALLITHYVRPPGTPPPALQFAPWALLNDLTGLQALATQFLPSQAPTLAVVVMLGLIGSIGVLVRHRVVIDCMLWLLAYCGFVAAAQIFWKRPAPVVDLRMLTPLLPAIVLALVAAAEPLIAARRHILSAAVVITLLLSAARALHGVAGTRHAAPQLSCQSRTSIIEAIRSRHITAASVASNAPGAAWFALRRPVSSEARPGEPFLWIDSTRVCGTDLVESHEPPPAGALVLEIR